MNIEEMLNMRLHQQENIGDYLQVTRVIGGWIYNQYVFESNTTTSVFVPEKK